MLASNVVGVPLRQRGSGPGLTPGLFMPVLSSEELDLEWWREVALLEEQVTFLDDRLMSANCHDKGLRIKSTKPKSLNCKKSS